MEWRTPHSADTVVICLKEERLLVDLGPLELHSESKVVAPLDEQHELETRKVWHPVTQALRKKDWPSASKHKVALEQKQRDEAAERKKKGEVYVTHVLFPNVAPRD